MQLNPTCIDMLMDLVEIKLGAMEVSDREDHHDFHVLKQCKLALDELRRQSPSAGLVKRPVGRPARFVHQAHAA